MRKPTKTPLLMQLPQAQRDALAGWLMEDGITYHQAVARLKEKFGIRIGRTAVFAFWQSYCAPLILNRPQAKDAAPVLLEIVIEVTPANTVRLKIIPGAGVKVEGQTS
ncbi:MAG: hypothetical protein JWR26_4845 [Pedosphaera sp.]|nr:hypothetical protein [Pedosphaera sp.]